MAMRTKQFQILTDADLAWELMTDVFTPDECNGPAAPFFEYALTNKLAYLEPLCTVPKHRHKGLAAAALSEHDRRLRPLGARLMTGGVNDFYGRIGYRDAIVTLHYTKIEKEAK